MLLTVTVGFATAMEGAELKARSGTLCSDSLISKDRNLMANERECRLLIKQLNIQYESGH
jgi:hypothetical protein